MVNWLVEKINKSLASEIVVKNHYLHRKPNCIHSFGLYDNELLLGIIIYGIPASNSVMQLCGKDEQKNVIELVRLWTVDDGQRNKESYLISHSLKMLPYEIVISYADASYGHVGIVYQATNWIYTGLTDRHVAWKIDGEQKQHSRHFFDNYGGIEKAKEVLGNRMTAFERPQKHRYIFFNTDRRRKKELLKKLKYSILPYPKADKVYVSPLIDKIESENIANAKLQYELFSFSNS
jgi:hypothetical protein